MARLAKDGPATTADLARAESMKPQSMGTTIAALEEMGIVERKPHPTDGRQMNIELTAKRRRRAEERQGCQADVVGAGHRPARRTGTGNAVRGGRNHQAPGGIVSSPSLARLAGAAPPQLPALLLRSGHLADRHLDDAAGHQLAGLSPDPFGAAAGHRQLRGADRLLRAGALCGRLGGAPQSPQAAGVDASRRRRPVARPGRAHAGARHHPLGNHRAHRFAGLDQCVRHARPPILPRADGRGS